jgi:hypothetical protein
LFARLCRYYFLNFFTMREILKLRALLPTAVAIINGEVVAEAAVEEAPAEMDVEPVVEAPGPIPSPWLQSLAPVVPFSWQ